MGEALNRAQQFFVEWMSLLSDLYPQWTGSRSIWGQDTVWLCTKFTHTRYPVKKSSSWNYCWPPDLHAGEMNCCLSSHIPRRSPPGQWRCVCLGYDTNMSFQTSFQMKALLRGKSSQSEPCCELVDPIFFFFFFFQVSWKKSIKESWGHPEIILVQKQWVTLLSGPGKASAGKKWSKEITTPSGC